jgi:hypothetical protein
MVQEAQGLITVKQLADRAGIKPAVLRRIFRRRFPREPKRKAEKTELPKSSAKPGEIDPTTGGTVIDLKSKNSKPIRKTLAQLKKEGVKVSEAAVVE